MATTKEQLQLIVDAKGIGAVRKELKKMEKATGGASKSFGGMVKKIGTLAGGTAAN